MYQFPLQVNQVKVVPPSYYEILDLKAGWSKWKIINKKYSFDEAYSTKQDKWLEVSNKCSSKNARQTNREEQGTT